MTKQSKESKKLLKLSKESLAGFLLQTQQALDKTNSRLKRFLGKEENPGDYNSGILSPYRNFGSTSYLGKKN